MGLFVRAMSVWQYRGFVVSSIANEFRTRLSRSRLGTAWIVLQPLAMVLIFATVLSDVTSLRSRTRRSPAFAFFIRDDVQ